MKPVIRNLGIFLSVAFVLLACWRGRTVPFNDQWPLYEALRNTAAIIFAVVGAWLAIVYPERLRLSLSDREDQPGSDSEGRQVSSLMTPIVHSTAILAAVLLVGICAPLARELSIVRDHVFVFRGLSYGILTTLTLWQLWTVVLTLVPASEVSTQDSRRNRRARTIKNVLGRPPRKRPNG